MYSSRVSTTPVECTNVNPSARIRSSAARSPRASASLSSRRSALSSCSVRGSGSSARSGPWAPEGAGAASWAASRTAVRIIAMVVVDGVFTTGLPGKRSLPPRHAAAVGRTGERRAIRRTDAGRSPAVKLDERHGRGKLQDEERGDLATGITPLLAHPAPPAAAAAGTKVDPPAASPRSRMGVHRWGCARRPGSGSPGCGAPVRLRADAQNSGQSSGRGSGSALMGSVCSNTTAEGGIPSFSSASRTCGFAPRSRTPTTRRLCSSAIPV